MPAEKRLSHAWLWLSPLAVGGAAFLWTWHGASPSPAAAAEKPAARLERNPAPHRADAAAALQQARKDIEAAQNERQARLAARTPEERRAEFLELLRQEKSAEDFLKIGDFEQAKRMLRIERRLWELSEEMAREEGLPAMQWLETRRPEVLASALDAWSERSPLEAFDYLAQSNWPVPHALIRMLGPMFQARIQAGGGAALLDAVQRAPWPLFADGDVERFDLEGIDPQLWVSSGAGRYLSSQGVTTPGLVTALVKTSPDLAIQAWADGARIIPAGDDPALKGLIAAAMDDDTMIAAGVRAALAAAGPETQTLLRATLTETICKKAHPGDADEEGKAQQCWEAFFPGEKAPLPESAKADPDAKPPQGEEEGGEQ